MYHVIILTGLSQKAIPGQDILGEDTRAHDKAIGFTMITPVSLPALHIVCYKSSS